MRERLALTTLTLPALPADGVVSAHGYSLFKHGDARLARVYGRALGALWLQGVDLREVSSLCVTASGFGAVAPAAYSLVRPFAQWVRAAVPVSTFEVRRRGISAGDYAQMTPGARKVAVSSSCMQVDGGLDLRGARVVALDDIRVTGTHEQAMDECLTAAGAAAVDHLYLVDAHAFADEPTVESRLNLAAVPDVDALLRVVERRSFVPNARVCRRVMQLPVTQLERFVAGAPEPVLGWMLRAVELDRLERVGPYRAGVTAFRELTAALDGPAQTATA
ncbi:phosphoribosyltransferase family protein [Leekyejoonella antrihumi]|nr:phosphoribosyltransferase family protein [Leekyejoonella antrihumi]